MGHPLVSQDHLAHGHLSGGDLPHSRGDTPGKLGQNQKTGNELSKPEEQANSELGNSDETDAKLADGNYSFGHPAFPPAVDA
jgi:hypothetical protein